MRSTSSKADGSTPWVVDFWSEATWVDYAATALIVGAYFVATKLAHGGDWLRSISADQRLAVYGTGATIVSIVGGLSVIAITIYITANGERARAVRATYGKGMRRNWRALFVGLGLSSLSCLVAQAIDGIHDPLSSRVLFVAAMVFAAWRFLRLLWLFDALIGVMDRDLTDTGRLPAPTLGNAWKEPEQPLASRPSKLQCPVPAARQTWLRVHVRSAGAGPVCIDHQVIVEHVSVRPAVIHGHRYRHAATNELGHARARLARQPAVRQSREHAVSHYSSPSASSGYKR